MRKDAGVDGDAQRIGQLGWMLFLKIFDDREIETELEDDDYESPIPTGLRWDAWADEDLAGTDASPATTLLDFVNNKLVPDAQGPGRRPVHRQGPPAGRAAPQRLRGRLQLHEVRHVDAPGDQQDQRHRLQRLDDRHTVRRHLRAAPQGPPVRRQRRRVLHARAPSPSSPSTWSTRSSARPSSTRPAAPAASSPAPSSTCAAAGRHAEPKLDELKASIRGIEKKPLPHLLCMTNLMLHGIDVPVQHPPRQHARPPAARLRPEGPGRRHRHQPALRRHGRGRHRDQLPRRVPHPRDRRPVPRAAHEAAQGRRPRRPRAARRHALRRRRQDPHQEAAARRVQPPHHRPPAQRRLRPLHRHQDQPPLLHQGRADQGRLVLRAPLSRGLQELHQDQADPHRGVRAREGVVGRTARRPSRPGRSPPRTSPPVATTSTSRTRTWSTTATRTPTSCSPATPRPPPRSEAAREALRASLAEALLRD